MTNFALLDQMLAEANRRMDAVHSAEAYVTQDIEPHQGITFYTEAERASMRPCREPVRESSSQERNQRDVVAQVGQQH